MNFFWLIENAVVGLHGLECSLLPRAYKRACARLKNDHLLDFEDDGDHVFDSDGFAILRAGSPSRHVLDEQYGFSI